MSKVLLFFLLAFLVANANGKFVPVITNQIHLLRPKSGSAGNYIYGLSCQSWRFGVETNNVRGWKTIPEECEGYIGHYMLGSQYRLDSQVVSKEAFHYATKFKVSLNGTDVWIFDIDETTLCNLPYYAEHGFGAEPFDEKEFNEWIERAEAPALPESLTLYRVLLRLGIKIVFLTGRPEEQRTVTEANLKLAGYDTWLEVLLREKEFLGKPAAVYKSAQRKKLEEAGYRIIGNTGDQWSDLLGTNTGIRTFKLPDPMYYIG